MSETKFNSKKRHLFEYSKLFHPEMSRSDFEEYIREINNFKRPINETITRLYYCPWVFSRFIERRKIDKNKGFNILQKHISFLIENLELKYYGL